MEKGEGCIKFVRKGATLDLCPGMDGALIELKIAAKEGLYLPMSGSRDFLTGRDCPDQFARNNFTVWEDQNQTFQLFIFESEALCLLVCPTAYPFGHFFIFVKEILTNLLHVEKYQFQRILICWI